MKKKYEWKKKLVGRKKKKLCKWNITFYTIIFIFIVYKIVCACPKIANKKRDILLKTIFKVNKKKTQKYDSSRTDEDEDEDGDRDKDNTIVWAVCSV